MKKLYRPTSKTFLKIAGGRIYTAHPTPLDPSLTISYRNHQKNPIYFSHLAPLVLFFYSKRQGQKEGMAQCLPPINTPLCTMFKVRHNLQGYKIPDL